MAARTGPFWDFVEGRTAPPPIAQLLGFTLRTIDPDAMTIEVGFTIDERFANPVGDVQGGVLSAMLDDTMGPAIAATLAPGEWAPTTDLHTQFLAPARPGGFVGRGRVVRRGAAIAFLAGELYDDRERLVATATATAAIRRPATSRPQAGADAAPE